MNFNIDHRFCSFHSKGINVSMDALIMMFKSLVPMFIDRETVVTLIKEIVQPLISLNNEDEPSTIDIEVEKVAQNLAQKAKSDPYFNKVLETVKDAASEETEKWIRNAVTRAFELLKQTVDPEGSSS